MDRLIPSGPPRPGEQAPEERPQTGWQWPFVIAVLVVGLYLSLRPGADGPREAPTAVPLPVAGGLDLAAEGVLLRLDVPAEGRRWEATAALEWGPIPARAGLSGRLLLTRTLEAAPATATAAGEVGLALTQTETDLSVLFWDDEDPDPLSAGPLIRLMSGYDLDDLAGAADGIPITLSLTPRGGIRDVAGLTGLAEAFAAALGEGVSAADLGWTERDWRAEIASALEELAAADLPATFSFLEGPLPEERILMDSVFVLTERDFLALAGAKEGADPPPFSFRWSLTPVGARPGVVVYDLVVAGRVAEDGFLEAELTGSGELEVEAATGLPRSLFYTVDFDWDALWDGLEEAGDYAFPISLTVTLEPV